MILPLSALASLSASLDLDGSSDDVSWTQLDRFIRFSAHLRMELSLGLPDPTLPPGLLPDHVTCFLSRSLNLQPITVSKLWSQLRHSIWGEIHAEIHEEERKLFDLHGAQTTEKNHRLGINLFIQHRAMF